MPSEFRAVLPALAYRGASSSSVHARLTHWAVVTASSKLFSQFNVILEFAVDAEIVCDVQPVKLTSSISSLSIFCNENAPLLSAIAYLFVVLLNIVAPGNGSPSLSTIEPDILVMAANAGTEKKTTKIPVKNFFIIYIVRILVQFCCLSFISACSFSASFRAFFAFCVSIARPIAPDVIAPVVTPTPAPIIPVVADF